MKYGQYPAAQMLFLGCLQEAGGGFGENYFNLGLSSLRMGNYNLGRLCLQEALQADPPTRKPARSFPTSPSKKPGSRGNQAFIFFF